ncbi:prepilin-type N-terminal cleavage/methylation domain-containing protein [Lentisphaera profundi]|uniref:Prepilin-type N-terminal cleavage/methylation domain-containing protein n=1 Tax=Lentisphaera profundi TaxID=1658616 RepID=A0ABY7W558_9BACT|nr:prepilin-type N-terminal cleavage/methylation domain-containing protein [Lentisphaera profundi]WDE99388.1 prepilin-type N-terminal cleavage/methylation domain-containing protein [Lentisphaera profundi]
MHFKYQASLAHHRKLYTFTLIELLVVVAIIGILASLLMPSLSKSREKARIAVCTNNQKQISTSTFMFMDDNEGYFPANDKDSGIGWDDRLSSYDSRNLTDAQISGFPGESGLLHMNVAEGSDHAPMYRCPLDDRVLPNDFFILKTYDISLLQEGNSELRGISGFSVVFPAGGGFALPNQSRKINDISSTSETIAYTENHAPVVGDAGNELRSRIGNSWTFGGLSPTITANNLAKHSDMKFNFAMADGHIQKMNHVQSMIRSDGTVASNADTADTKWDAEK